MSKKRLDLVIKVGEYTNSQGEKKSRFQNVGVMIEGDKGPYLLLEKTFNPAGIQDGKSSVLISIYEKKPKGFEPRPEMSEPDFGGPGPVFDSDDNIPF